MNRKTGALLAASVLAGVASFAGCESAGPPRSSLSSAGTSGTLTIQSASSTATVDAEAPDAQEISAIEAYLGNSYYATTDIVYSFETKFGEQIDCIDFHAQHSVKFFAEQGLQLDPDQIPPAPQPPPGVNPPQIPPHLAFNGELDQNGNARQCPTGTVATTRPTVAAIEMAGGLAAFQSQSAHRAPPCGNTCSNLQSCFEHDCFLEQSVPTSSYDHVTGIQTQFGSALYGILTYMPVYWPTVTNYTDQYGTPEHSVSQIWLQTGQCENWYNTSDTNQCPTGNGVQNQAVQSMEAGWVVEGGSGTNAHEATLFAFITQDGYFRGNCWGGQGGDCCTQTNGQNSSCWVAATNPQYTLNQVFDASDYGGQPDDEMAVQVWNGSADGSPGWWMWVNGSLVGWYPPNSFTWPSYDSGGGTLGPMAYGPATYLQVGGEVYNVWPSGLHTSTQMGGGYAPPTFTYGYAGYDRNILWLSGDGAYASTSLEFFDAPSCEDDYSVSGVCGLQAGYWTNNGGYGAYSSGFTGAPNNNWGEYFFFGGGEGQCKGGIWPCN